MIKVIMGLLIFVYCICGCQRFSRQESDKQEGNLPFDDADPAWRVGDFEEPKLEVPDSLGGKKLTGFLVLSISVHKSGKLLGYKIRKIVVTLDTTKAPIEYFDMRPHVDAVTRSAQADSLLRVFAPWVDQYYNALKFTINKDDPALAVYDTATVSYDIRFNLPRKSSILR